ncbi:hypothetical protein EPIR_0388 [Erwinia piriflorinigrans CFBP 5888]|uniref:Uncharacterized protein n=1 Tax=Erwinia piriflorinigrans CFBP 5888 TaxID=1161919 RepID=V5Z462_9GAMM|nr:hypothetical protein EPIR_0388 [Erwinia piriflorinigrans CFBP 5888]
MPPVYLLTAWYTSLPVGLCPGALIVAVQASPVEQKL